MAEKITKKVLVDLDFNGNHIKNVGMEVLDKDPSPFESRFYINANGYVRLYFKGVWHDVAYVSNIKEVLDYAQEVETRVVAIESGIEGFDEKISSLSASDKSIQESINQIKSDNHISPNEKKILKNLWDNMNAEYSEIIGDAARYDVDIQDYATAYEKAVAAFRKYTDTSIDYILIEPDFDNISAYYLERSIVQGLINTKIKGGISEAEAAADAAQKAADKAAREADDAKKTLDRWAADNVISPVEKFSLKNEKAKADADYVDIKKQTERYMLVDEVPLWNAFDEAYRSYVDKIDAIAAEPGDSDVDNLQNLQDSYYSARTAILSAIAVAAKKIADDAATDAEAAKQIAENALNTAAGAQSFIDSTIAPEIETLNRRLDGVVENWFYDYTPTTGNYPASEWTTEDERTNHIGDTFTNTQVYVDDATTPDAGKSWRWVKNPDGSFSWTVIADSDAVKALQQAAQAQSTADGKSRTFYNTPHGPYDKGDLWMQGEAGDIMVCITSRTTGFLSSDWALASKYTDDSALESFINGSFSDTIDELEGQIDGKAETWYQSADPATAWTTSAERARHKGDMWYDTSTGNTYRYDGSAWQKQNIPNDVFDQIDGKAQIFVRQPNPPYKVGDLWVQGSTGDILKCITSSDTTFSISHWALASKYTDDSAANVAKAAADAAKTAADQARETAEQAKTSLEDMASDSIISPVEKTALAQQTADIMSEYAQIIASADKYAVTTATFTTAYESAIAALGKYTANPTQNTSKESDFDDIAAYYTARQTILDSIAAAVKKNADDAAKLAEDAKEKADDAEVKAEAAKSAAAAALADSKTALADVAKLNDDNYFSVAEKRGIREMMSAITSVKGLALVYSGLIERTMVNGEDWTVVSEDDVKDNEALKPYIGYYRSHNKGIDDSYSTTKLTFNLDSDAIVKINVASDGEALHDYLAVSKIDETENLTSSNVDIAEHTTKNKKGQIISLEYGLKKGLHTLQIMYLKDGSINKDTDSGYYKITTEHLGKNNGLYGSFHRLYWQYIDKLGQETVNMYTALLNLTRYLVETCKLWNNAATDFTSAENETAEPFREKISKYVRDYYEAEDTVREKGPVSDLEYLQKIFPNRNIVSNGAVIAQIVGVANNPPEDEEAKIVAGLNGTDMGASTEHGKVLVFAGADGIQNIGNAKTRIYEDGTIITKALIAEDSVFSGNITATSGTIGGFKIIGNTLFSEKNKFTIDENGISLKTGDYTGSISLNVPKLMQSGFLLDISTERISMSDPLYSGIRLSCKDNASDSVAIQVDDGCFVGFRPFTRRLTGSGTLSKIDSVITMTNSSPATLTLPSSPEQGQMYFIIHITGTAFTLSGNGKSIRQVSSGSINTTHTIKNKEMWMVFYDGLYWEAIYAA